MVDHCLRARREDRRPEARRATARIVADARARRVASRRIPCKPVDATGAGDAFGGAFVARLVAGDDLEARRALRRGGRGAVDRRLRRGRADSDGGAGPRRDGSVTAAPGSRRSRAGFAPDLFAGRTVLVVGGDQRHRRAASRQAFAAHGATVVATGATDAEIEAARRRDAGSRARGRCGASTCATTPPSRALVEGLGELDVLVNCAGIIRRGDEHDPDVFAAVVDINLSGTMRVCSAARAAARTRAAAASSTPPRCSASSAAGWCRATPRARAASRS